MAGKIDVWFFFWSEWGSGDEEFWVGKVLFIVVAVGMCAFELFVI